MDVQKGQQKLRHHRFWWQLFSQRPDAVTTEIVIVVACAPRSTGPTSYLVGGDWLPSILFSHILGISSSQLTFIFFRGVAQTPTRKFVLTFVKPLFRWRAERSRCCRWRLEPSQCCPRWEGIINQNPQCLHASFDDMIPYQLIVGMDPCQGLSGRLMSRAASIPAGNKT